MDITTSATDLTAKYVPAEVDGEPRVITIHGDINAPTIEVWVCQWSPGCAREAVSLTAHPILGEVPTCAECAAFVERMKS